MKKLLRLTFLILCAFLMSCNNPFSDKTGNISFSFQADEMIQAANSYAARADATNNDQGQNQITYTFLAQIKGSRGYYACSDIKTVTVQNTQTQNQNQNGIGNGYFIMDPYAAPSQYITENTVDFNFNRIPANQTYKVMFDMFMQKGTDEPVFLVLSGHTADVEVLPGLPADVTVGLDQFESSPFSMVIEYEDGDSKIFDNPSALATMQNAVTFDGPGNNFPVNTAPNIYKKYGKLWHQHDTPEGNMIYSPIKNIYYKMDSDSNFADSDYKYSIPFKFYNSETVDKTETLVFNDTIGSLNDILLKYSSFPNTYATANSSSRPSLLPQNLTMSKTTSNETFSFNETIPHLNFKSEDEIISGHLANKKLEFDKITNMERTESSFVYAVSLNNLIGTIDLGDDSERCSLALVLTMRGTNPVPSSKELYYSTEDDITLTDIKSSEHYETLLSSNCINHATDETRFVIPLNNLSFEIGDPYFILLIKNENNLTQDSLDYYFDIDYYIFPESMHAHIFDVSDPNENKNYRYQIDKYFYYWNEDYNHKNVTSELSGAICYFNTADRSFSMAQTRLTAELYYMYWKNIGTQEDQQYVCTFQAISNNAASGNVKELDTSGNIYNYDRSDYEFVFNDVVNITSDDQDIYFKCTAPYKDANTLLVVRDYQLEKEYYPNN